MEELNNPFERLLFEDISLITPLTINIIIDGYEDIPGISDDPTGIFSLYARLESGIPFGYMRQDNIRGITKNTLIRRLNNLIQQGKFTQRQEEFLYEHLFPLIMSAPEQCMNPPGSILRNDGI